MSKYRYRRDYFADDDLIDRLNDLGEQGWSLLGQPRWVPGDGTQYTAGVWRCFLKRTVSNREQVQQVFALSPQREDGR